LKTYYVRSQSDEMVPLGSLADIQSTVGPAVIQLYNLFPSATINGATAAKYSSGQTLDTVQGIADRVLEPGLQFEWTAMSYQEKLVGKSVYYIFGMAVLLVYLVLAGQYESWVTPAAVILAVPLALLGTVSVLLTLGVANNIYVQIGLVLLIALSAKNAILILTSVTESAQVRFRPILMTSFVFILGVMPLVFASGAGASARKSLGIAVASGMLASTCLAVLFVPSFFVVLQRFVERKPRTGPPPDAKTEIPPTR
jgi:HAE1 family hydrophobic/amphiphilic exporter-1